jgi:hypothetical protein
MNQEGQPILRGFRLFGKAILSVLVVSGITDVACTQGVSQRADNEVTPHRIELLPPGTIIGQGPPKGWSFLVIKTHPRPGTGDMAKVNDSTYHLASFLFTGFVANARAEQVGGRVQYRLDKVATGLGTRINRQDIIISPETQRRLGANLGLLARVVLDKTYALQQDNLVVVSFNTMAIVDTHAVMLRGTGHRPVILRYSLLLDAGTGKLETLVWMIDRDNQGKYTGVGGTIEWLPPNKVQDVILHVDGKEFTLGVPTENAFGISELPRGQKQLAMPDDLKPIAGQKRLGVEAARHLERRLREMLLRPTR